MKNSDKPAYPTEYDPQLHWDESVNGIKTTDLDGLTKREKFAMAAMQGILSNPEHIGDTTSEIVRQSIYAADELLKQIGGRND